MARDELGMNTGNGLYRTYRTLSTLASPLVRLWLMQRQKQGKEDASRLRERLGYAAFPRPAGPLVWFHAASVGESNSVLPFIQHIAVSYPGVNILVTTGTTTSAALLGNKLPERAFHQFVPVDTPGAVSRFLSHWKPDLVFWVESELWPNLVLETQRRGCKQVLINARMSEKSYVNWQRFPGLAERMLLGFTCCFAQTAQDAERLSALGAKDVRYFGNLKFDAPPLSADAREVGKLVSMVGERPLWVAASTHPGEEEKLAKVQQKLKKQHPGLITIIVPRHANRGSDLSAMLEGQGLKVAQRSKEEPIEDDTDIYIADTMGELGIFYRIAGIVFMGGSLVDHGGQNPLEAARLDCAILTGPYTQNFSEICKELASKGGLLRVKDSDDLQAQLHLLLKDHARQEEVAQAAIAAVGEMKGPLDHILECIQPLLTEKLGQPADDSAT